MTGKLLIIGLDGVDFKSISHWMKEGKLPCISRLVREGAHGNLMSTIPAATSTAIPVFLTGKNPGRTGSMSFTRPDGRLRTLRDIHAPTLLEVVSLNGLKMASIGLPFTYPPPNINGWVVADSRFIPSRESSFTRPLELQEEIQDLYPVGPPPGQIDKKGRFLPDLEFQQNIEDVGKKFAVARLISRTKKPDVLLLYIIETDEINHRIYNCRDTLLRFYVELDKLLGDFLRTERYRNLILFSDHGFHSFPKFSFYINSWLKRENYLVTYSDRLARLAGWVHKYLNRKMRKELLRMSEILTSLLQHPNSAGPSDVRPPGILGIPGVDYKKSIGFSNTNLGIRINPKTEDYEIIRNRLLCSLSQLNEFGRRVFLQVWRREEVYSGPYSSEVPDIVLVPSEQFSVGLSLEKSTCERLSDEDVRRRYGAVLQGFHSSAIYGIFIAQGEDIKSMDVKKCGIIDLAPTIFHLLGLPISGDMDGRVLIEIFEDDSEPASNPIQYEDYEKKSVKERIQYLKSAGRF